MGDKPIDLTSAHLGNPIDIFRSPLQDGSNRLLTAEKFQSGTEYVKLVHIFRSWHPQVSNNGDIPALLGRNHMFVMAPTQVEPIPSDTANLMPKIIELYAGIFITEREHLSKMCPKVKHIIISDENRVIGGLSYVCDGSSSTVVSQLTTPTERRVMPRFFSCPSSRF